MKLTATTQVSVDGVMQAPGGPEEDERGVFERGGWAHFDNRGRDGHGRHLPARRRVPVRQADLRDLRRHLGDVGRSGQQPHLDGVEHEAQVRGIYHTHDPRWTNTTVLSSDVAAAVRELKAKPGRELQVQGSGAFLRWLLDNDLVDEMNLFTFPVVIGQGMRLFPDTGRDNALELVESRATPSGVAIQVYRFAGRPQYQTAALPFKLDRSRRRSN